MPDQLNSDADAIERYCRDHYPDAYVGLRLDHGRNTVILYRRPAPGVDRDVRARFPDTNISIETATYSAGELAALRQQVKDDVEFWRRQGIEIRFLSTAPDGSAVLIGTAHADRDREAIERRYGRDRVRVHQKSAEVFPPYRGPIPGLPPPARPADR
jgi:hypothetical protein